MTGPIRDRHLVVRQKGHTATLTLDGVELQHGVRGFILTADAGEWPTLVLDPVVVSSDVEVNGPLVVKILPETHAVLVALGWRPPLADDEHEPVEINTPAVRYRISSVLNNLLAGHVPDMLVAQVVGSVFVAMNQASAGRIPDIDEQDAADPAPDGPPA